MKKHTYLPILLGTALLTGCSLDEDPKSKLSEEQAFQNSTLTYVNSVASVYSSISNGWYGSTESIHTLAEFTSDATMLPGRQGDWVDGGKWQNMFLHNFQSSVDTYATVWNHIFQIIGNCNSNIDKLKGFGSEYDDYVNELRALRAIYYYNACDLFANVPIVTSSEQSISTVNQSSRSEVYKFVISELTEVLPSLSEESATSETSNLYGRINKAAALMCLAKMAINAPVFTTDVSSATSLQAFVGDDLSGACKASETLGQAVTTKGNGIQITVGGQTRNAWQTVIYCVEQLEALGYRLESDYSKNFAVSNSTSAENIWVRPNDDKIYMLWDCNLMRSLHYNHAGGMGYSGWNGACATVRAMQIMGYGTADQDPRLALNYYTGTDYTADTGGLVNDGATSQSLEYSPLKAVVDFGDGSDPHDVKCAGARFKKYEYDKTSTIQGDMNNDLVIWRYGDALLLKAEAEYRLGETGNALNDVNKVRQRAGAPDRTSLTLNDILDERMIELPWEGVRRQDQIRFCTFTQPTVDRYVGVLHNAAAGDYTADREGWTNVYPIPYSVINLNTNLKQNPGYAN
jgi:hypothetical protein